MSKKNSIRGKRRKQPIKGTFKKIKYNWKEYSMSNRDQSSMYQPSRANHHKKCKIFKLENWVEDNPQCEVVGDRTIS